MERPKRIVSLVPSQTELLYSLGLDAEVCGITKFCVHPEEWFRGKTRVGGTKNVDVEKIRSLQPDLVLANKEENVREQIEALALEFPVWVSDVNDLDDALAMIRSVGEITGRIDKAVELEMQISKGFEDLDGVSGVAVRTGYLIWRSPYMSVGGDTFIHEMMKKAGFENVFGDLTRYPQVDVKMLQDANCEVLLLSSEPYPFKQKHIDELKEQLPNTHILLADGELFSWYGSRLLHAPSYFIELRRHVLSLRNADRK